MGPLFSAQVSVPSVSVARVIALRSSAFDLSTSPPRCALMRSGISIGVEGERSAYEFSGMQMRGIEVATLD